MHNFPVRDIWLDSANAVLDLNEHTLFVNSEKHDLGVNQVINEGEIIWWIRPPGSVYIFR